MSYTVKKKIKRPIVCTLKDGSTLRLPINGQTTIKDSQITEHIKTRLDPHRFLHSVNVSKCAGELAAAYGAPLILSTNGGAAEACLRISRRLRGVPTPLMKL